MLLESTPADIDLSALRATVAEVDDVVDIHDLHVWSLSSNIRALSAHVVVGGRPSLQQAEMVSRHVKDTLGKRFGIAHATLEFETTEGSG